jgi:hypothetical protein
MQGIDMKRILALVLVLGMAPAVWAEDVDEGFDLIEEGAQMLLRGLMQEIEPAIEDIESMVDDIGPAFHGLLDLMDEIRHYEQPEILPNGDIIIRRSPDAPPFEADEDAGDEGIEL